MFSLQELPKLITSNGVAWLGVTWEMMELTIRDCCIKGFLACEKLDCGPSKFEINSECGVVECGACPVYLINDIINGDALSD